MKLIIRQYRRRLAMLAAMMAVMVGFAGVSSVTPASAAVLVPPTSATNVPSTTKLDSFLNQLPNATSKAINSAKAQAIISKMSPTKAAKVKALLEQVPAESLDEVATLLTQVPADRANVLQLEQQQLVFAQDAMTSTGAIAATTTCPANVLGGAPCFPGDVNYSAAAYECRYTITGDVWGIPMSGNMYICMSFMLIKWDEAARAGSAGLSHIVDLYEHWSTAQQIWAFVSLVAFLMYSYFQVLVDALSWLRPLVCIYVVAAMPESYQAATGIGCGFADLALSKAGH